MSPRRQESPGRMSHVDGLLGNLFLQVLVETGWGSHPPRHTSYCEHGWDLGLILIYFQAR